MDNKLEKLVAELDTYLPAALQNQAHSKNAPTGDGTLKGFHAKIAEVFQLGRSVGGAEVAGEFCTANAWPYTENNVCVLRRHEGLHRDARGRAFGSAGYER